MAKRLLKECLIMQAPRQSPVVEKAHNVFEKFRTEDVIIQDNIHFSDLLLSETTLKGLESYGFIKPSPIQRKAIPIGRCGFDLTVQAKSGTGKTCVFAVIALEMVETELEKLQVLILAPTREIAVQIKDVISSIGKNRLKLKVEIFIGGCLFANDKQKLQKCQIAVGTPGRIKHLITSGQMNVSAVRLFVLDEADKLMEKSFRQDISSIYLKLPEVKQVIASSATFPHDLGEFVTRYMTSPVRVSPGREPFLIGIRQFVSIVPYHLNVLVQMNNKLAELCRILSTIPFDQCLVFSNYQSRAKSISNKLTEKGWPTIHISGDQKQDTRLKTISSFKNFFYRVLLSTDLTSRGIDVENVNLVINLDLPYDGATYLHRIGRAGRYGTRGMVITIVQDGPELFQFQKMLSDISCDFLISVFPKKKLNFDIWEAKDEDFEKISSTPLKNNHQNPVESEINEEQCKPEVQERIEVKSKTLDELWAFHSFPKETPNICEYKDLLRDSFDRSNFNEFEVISGETKDYPDVLKSLIMYLEKEVWNEHRKKVEELERNRKPEILEDTKSESLRLINECESEETSENKLSQVYRSAFFEAVRVDNLRCCCDNYDSDNESCTEEEKSENESRFERESEGSAEEASKDTFYIEQWYSLCYSQLHAIRNYVNYRKYFQYSNELYNFK